MIDTYDPERAIDRLAAEVRQETRQVTGVRLDSGDLVQLSQRVRQALPQVKIFASGDLDEEAIIELQKQGAALDGYGLGTKLVTGAPVNGVYKLVTIDGKPTCKRSAQKATYGGNKQIFRRVINGQWQGDRLRLATESPQPGETPLLQRVMSHGQRELTPLHLTTTQRLTRQSVQTLPAHLRQPTVIRPATVSLSDALLDLQAQIPDLMAVT